MDLRNLECFIEVVKLGGFNSAANSLNIPQPSVTRRIKQLEAELDEKLLERGPWGMRPTEKGRAFYAAAQRVVAAMREAREATQDAWAETIRLGAAATAAGSFLAKVLSDWIREHPKAHLIMIEGGASGMRRQLENRVCDLGIIAAPVPEHFEHRFVTRVTVQALLPPNHPLAVGDGPLPITMLDGERVLLNGNNFLSTELVRFACNLEGVNLETVYECSVGQTLAALAESGLGIALMGDSVDLRGFNLPRRPLSTGNAELLTFDLHIAWLQSRQLSKAMHNLIEKLTHQSVD
jgi:LysR family hydrogen peroxide-inducible transcriptional activator